MTRKIRWGMLSTAKIGVKIGEAFMIRSYTQWLRVSELIRGGRGETGRIGALRAVNAHFSYFNADPKNIRNQVESGGGGSLLENPHTPLHSQAFFPDPSPPLRQGSGAGQRQAWKVVPFRRANH